MRAGIASLAALLPLFGSYAVAQEITATILGTVTDPSGAVVSGATIIVVNTDQAIVVRRLTTSPSGEYVVPLLPIGHYDVSVEASGFKTSLETGIELSVNDRRAVNFILQVHGLIDLCIKNAIIGVQEQNTYAQTERERRPTRRSAQASPGVAGFWLLSQR